MSTRIRLTKDYGSHKKGDVVELRSAEAKQAIKAKAAVVLTNIDPNNHQTKESSDGNTQRLRSNNRSRR